MKRVSILAVLLAVAVPAAFGQKFEIWAGGGGSFYQSKTITGPRGDASAGWEPGFNVSAGMGNNMYDKLGGEVRWTWARQDLKLNSGGTTVNMAGDSHAIHYDFLLHTAGKESDVRPYAAFGAGIKLFRGTGRPTAVQPLSNIGVLTQTSQWGPVASVGGGVKWRISETMMIRVDVHDYISTFPTNVITPAPGQKLGGWVNNIMASVALVYLTGGR